MTQSETPAAAGGPSTATKRGRLIVLVAAAPGAGKTYAMLEEGHRLREQGRDIVVGLVESYGRPKTEALLEGLEVIPRRVVHYKNVDPRRWTWRRSWRAARRSS